VTKLTLCATYLSLLGSCIYSGGWGRLRRTARPCQSRGCGQQHPRRILPAYQRETPSLERITDVEMFASTWRSLREAAELPRCASTTSGIIQSQNWPSLRPATRRLWLSLLWPAPISTRSFRSYVAWRVAAREIPRPAGGNAGFGMPPVKLFQTRTEPHHYQHSCFNSVVN
jgi:hypothetical protein